MKVCSKEVTITVKPTGKPKEKRTLTEALIPIGIIAGLGAIAIAKKKEKQYYL